MNAFRHGMDSQHLQQATSNPNIQRVLQKQVSLSNKRMSVVSSSCNTDAATTIVAQHQQSQDQQAPMQVIHQQQPQLQQQQQVSFTHNQQAGIPHIAPGASIPPYALQNIQGVAPPPTRISIPEQSSYSHTETAV